MSIASATDLAASAQQANSDDGAALERILGAVAGVVECAVVKREVGTEVEWIANIVPAPNFSLQRAQDAVKSAAPGAQAPISYVLIDRLPLTRDGAVDEAVLARLPLVDERAARGLERELKADPRVVDAVVFVDARKRSPAHLHLSEVLPPAALGAHGDEFVAKVSPTLAEANVADDAAETPDEGAPGPPAWCRGPELPARVDPVRTLPDLLRVAAERLSDPRITYLAPDGAATQRTYADLYGRAERICRGLQRHGVSRREYVLLQLTDPEEILCAFWGCLLGGFIPAITPVPPSYDAETSDLERIVHVCKLLGEPRILASSRLIGSMSGLRPRVSLRDDRFVSLEAVTSADGAAELPSLDPSDPAFLVFTSGSTGVPKIILLSHANILSRAQGTNILCGNDDGDRILNWLPFDHIGSISDWHLRCIDIRCQMFYCGKEYVLGEPLNWLRLIDRFRITHSWAPNFAYALLNDALAKSTESWDLSCMKTLLTAGEAVSSKTVQDFLKRLAPHGLPATALRPAFGMAELGSGVTYFLPTEAAPVRVTFVDRSRLEGRLRAVPPQDARALGFTSLGPVIPGTSMRIVDDQLQVLPEMTIGRLQIAGGPVCLGYFGNDEANREVFAGDGWFNTGDRGFIAKGELYLTGRDKESLIINGANFHNSEIEAAVEEVEGVEVSYTAACAVRRPGQAVESLAVFFAHNGVRGPQLAELLRRVQGQVARKVGAKADYLIPVAREVIPKTAIGKIQRKQLSRRFEDGEFDRIVNLAEVLLETDRTLPDWFLTPVWRPAALSVRGRAASAPQRFVIWPDGSGLAEVLVQELASRGCSATITQPGATPGDSVVDLVEYGPMQTSTAACCESSRTIQPDGSVSRQAATRVTEFLSRIRTLQSGSAIGAERRYLCVASHAQVVEAGEDVDVARTMLPPILKALSQEPVGVDTYHLDLEFAEDETSQRDRAARIADECLSQPREREVAYRGGARLVPKYAKASWDGGVRRPGLSSGALYVVTGGLGGIGSELVKYLLGRWRAEVLVLGRTALPADSAQSISSRDGERRQLLAEFAALGSVHYRTVDWHRPDELKALVEQVEAASGRKVSGVFHLAGAYHEKPALDEDASSLATTWLPKLDGALALHGLIAARPGAFIAYFSSLSAVFSGSGLSAYASANRFLDSLARLQHASFGVASYTFDWSLWQGLGIARAGVSREILMSKGYMPISPMQGLASLSAGLTREPGALLVGVAPDHPDISRLRIEPPSTLQTLVAVAALREGARQGDAQGALVLDASGSDAAEVWRFGPRILEDGLVIDREKAFTLARGFAAEVVKPSTPVETELVEIWREILTLESLGTTQSFFDLGGTSLRAVQLFAAIERRLGVSLPAATLFKAATVQAIARLVEQAQASTSKGSPRLLAAADAKRTLFFVHDSTGSVESYQTLSHLLQRVRCYGLEPLSADRFPMLHARIDAMVTDLVSQIRGVQPDGPYAIAGFGVGGNLAFEIACRLEGEGAPVALLAVLDSASSSGRWNRSLLKWILPRIATVVDRPETEPTSAHALGSELRSAGKRAFDAVRAQLLTRQLDVAGKRPWYLEHVPVDAMYRVAAANHEPSRFAHKIIVFRGPRHAAENGIPFFAPAPDLGWAERTEQGVTILEVPGAQGSMLAEPRVTELARKFQLALDEAWKAN